MTSMNFEFDPADMYLIYTIEDELSFGQLIEMMQNDEYGDWVVAYAIWEEDVEPLLESGFDDEMKAASVRTVRLREDWFNAIFDSGYEQQTGEAPVVAAYCYAEDGNGDWLVFVPQEP